MCGTPMMNDNRMWIVNEEEAFRGDAERFFYQKEEEIIKDRCILLQSVKVHRE